MVLITFKTILNEKQASIFVGDPVILATTKIGCIYEI